MHRWLLLPLLTLTTLGAEEVDSEQLNAIYTEAIWFVVIFGTMGIISFIYSNRHAKQYTQKQADTIAQNKSLAVEQTKRREDRVEELAKLVKDGLLTEKEFRILRTYIE